MRKVPLKSVCLNHLFTYRWDVCITQNSPYTVMWLLSMYLMRFTDLRTLFSPTDWQIVSTDRMRQPESSWACQVCRRTSVVSELRIHSTVTWKPWVLQLIRKKITYNLMHSWIPLVRTRLFRIHRYFFLQTISPADLSFTRSLPAFSNSIKFELFFDSPGSSK